VQFPPKVLYELSRWTTNVRHQCIPGTLHSWKEIIPRCSADLMGKAAMGGTSGKEDASGDTEIENAAVMILRQTLTDLKMAALGSPHGPHRRWCLGRNSAAEMRLLTMIRSAHGFAAHGWQAFDLLLRQCHAAEPAL